MVVDNYIIRLIDEFNMLNVRINNLEEFIKNKYPYLENKKIGINVFEKQLNYMKLYSDTLKERLILEGIEIE